MSSERNKNEDSSGSFFYIITCLHFIYDKGALDKEMKHSSNADDGKRKADESGNNFMCFFMYACILLYLQAFLTKRKRKLIKQSNQHQILKLLSNDSWCSRLFTGTPDKQMDQTHQAGQTKIQEDFTAKGTKSYL